MGLSLIVEVSTSHSDTPHSVVLLWTSDRLVAPDLQHSQESDIDTTGGIRTRNPGKRAGVVIGLQSFI
jgi:hypothetical protein